MPDGTRSSRGLSGLTRCDSPVDSRCLPWVTHVADNVLKDILEDVHGVSKLDATAEETMSPIARRPMLSSLPCAA